MAEKHQDLTEDLFQAIQTITDKTLDGLKYDKTILCSVTDDTNREEGQYTVSDGSVEFTAYSDNTKYREGNNVYVTIPEGSYDNRRIIIGKYQQDEETPYIYISPMENYVNITHNLINNAIIDPRAEGLVANGDIKLQLVQSLTGLSYSGYDRLGIRANFMSLLTEFNTTYGNYGLALKINCYEKRTTEYERTIEGEDGLLWTDENSNNQQDIGEVLTTLESGAKTQTYWLYFDSDDMFGNPYNFVAYTSQEKVFDISSFAQIDSIELYFYQGDNFLDNTDTPIPSFGKSIIDGIEIIDDFASNLFVNDIEITLGYDLSQFENNTVLLYTLDSKTYSAIADQNNGNLKTIEMRWIRDVNNNMMAFDENGDLLPEEDVEIHWYRWHLANNIYDDLAGAFWEEDTNLLTQSNKFKKVFHPAVNLQQERLKVIIVRHIQGVTEEDSYDEIFESNILELENEDQVPNPATIDLIRGLQLTTDDDYNGIYCLYGQNTELMNGKEASVERHLIASYESLVTGIKGLDGSETITWKVPAVNTMIGDIKGPGNNVAWNAGWTRQGDYRVLEGDIPSIANFESAIGETNDRKAYISYKIEPVYSQIATNNTVICIIHKNNLDYQAELPMSFGTAGTNGTDYTLVLEISDGDKHALTAGDTLQIRAQLRDYDNLPIARKIDFKWWKVSTMPGVTLSLPSYNEVDKFTYCTLTADSSLSNIGRPLIIEAKIIYNDITLFAQMPVPLCRSSYVTDILEGPTKVIYDNNGTNSIYIRKPYKLFNKKNQEKTISYWRVYLYETNGISALATSTNTMGYPTLNNNMLVPAQMYLDGLKYIPCVIAYNSSGTWLYIQPILIIQNHFGSSMLNRWDGTLQINETDNSILTSIIGAGRKENDNSFSGVLMGEVGKQDNNSTDNPNDTGLLGYDHGKRTFLLNSKTGKLILGTSGVGQITMDGTSGIIQSGNYASNSDGMRINLSSGAIDAYNFKLTSRNVIINSTGSDSEPNLLIKDNSSPQKTLMKVGSSRSNFFLQSADQNIKFDLGLSQFIAKNNFRFQALKENTGIDFGIGTTSEGAVDYPFFYIKKDNTNLFALDNNNYYLQSVNYNSLNHTGIRFNLNTGKITGYDASLKFDQSALQSFVGSARTLFPNIDESDLKKFYNGSLTAAQLKTKYNLTDTNINNLNDLKTAAPNNHTLFLDSTDSHTPFKVGSKFKINWDGSIASSGGVIGGWTIDANKLSSNSGSVGMAKYVDGDHPIFWSGFAAYGASDWKTQVGFGVSGSGGLFANSGQIGPWSIAKSALTGINSGGGQVITLKPSEITLGTYSQLTGFKDNGEPIFSSTTTKACIDANGNFTGTTFTGFLEGTARYAYLAYNSNQLEGHTSSYFAVAGHSHTYTHTLTMNSHSHTVSSVPSHKHYISLNVTTGTVLGKTVVTGVSVNNNGYTWLAGDSSVSTGSTTSTGTVTHGSGSGGGGGTGTSSCFIAGTQILMANGTTKNIEDIIIGDYIIAYDEQKEQFVPEKVLRLESHNNIKKLIKINFNNNNLILTPDHPILTINGWKSRDLGMAFRGHCIVTKYLTIDDFICGYFDKKIPIKAIENINNISKNLIVYNITVENSHTYIANGIIVHNALMVPKPW